jgi:hypothetical protein
MYQLERQAQDDPFLMDMLQGMENSDENHQTALDEIDRLIKTRVEQDRKRVIPLYRYWAAAACLLIALGIGGWWLTRTTTNPRLAENIKIAVPPGKFKAGQPPVIPEEKRAVAGRTNNTPAPLSAPKQLKTDTIVKELADNKAMTRDEVLKLVPGLKVDSAGNITHQYIDQVTKVRINGKDYAGGNVAQAVKNLPADILEKIQVNNDYSYQSGRTGVKTDSSKQQLIAANKALNQPNVLREVSINNPVTITGKVVDDKNIALPGASVSVNGGQQRVQTNADGSFTIAMPAKDATLDVAAIGYVRQQVKVNAPDNLNIQLKEDNMSLNEVVVTGYGTQKRSAVTGSVAAISKPNPGLGQAKQMADTGASKGTSKLMEVTKGSGGKELTPAEAMDGWKDYRAYIDHNAIMPDGSTGTVEATFDITKDGTINNIRVIKGTTKAMSDKAINIIKNGPKWKGANLPKGVRLQIVFHKKD